jgi:transcription antitermination factor NusG
MIMQKNWYAVYTKPQCEKKVAALFSKKKIDFFLPMCNIETKTFKRQKIVFNPLFKSIVFVYVTQEETALLKQINGVINLLYWLNKPAIIAVEEITTIKEFIEDYRNIKVEPAVVNSKEIVNNQNGSSFSIEGKLYAVTNKTIKVNLPTIGYSLVAEIEEENLFVRDTPLFLNYKFANS